MCKKLHGYGAKPAKLGQLCKSLVLQTAQDENGKSCWAGPPQAVPPLSPGQIGLISLDIWCIKAFIILTNPTEE